MNKPPPRTPSARRPDPPPSGRPCPACGRPDSLYPMLLLQTDPALWRFRCIQCGHTQDGTLKPTPK